MEGWAHRKRPIFLIMDIRICQLSRIPRLDADKPVRDEPVGETGRHFRFEVRSKALAMGRSWSLPFGFVGQVQYGDEPIFQEVFLSDQARFEFPLQALVSRWAIYQRIFGLYEECDSDRILVRA